MSTIAEDEIESCIPMVKHFARQLSNRLISKEDLEGAGMLAAVEARNAFDPSGPASFRSYAKHRICGAMIDARRNARMIRIPRRYHGESGAKLTGPAAEDARSMFAKRVVGESELGELPLAELAIDYTEETKALRRNYLYKFSVCGEIV
jgi:RNA polymerase sigma factor (sigma-70 family)